jgi:pantoate--beta-alanine ligase
MSIRTETAAAAASDGDRAAEPARKVTHLTPEERAAAPVLRRALLAARARWEAGERSGEALRQELRDVLATESLATPEYVSVADTGTLQELDHLAGPALLSMAVQFGSTRLIDNELLP